MRGEMWHVILSFLLRLTFSTSTEEEEHTLTFVNPKEKPQKLLWLEEPGQLTFLAAVPASDELAMDTFVGHSFGWMIGDETDSRYKVIRVHTGLDRVMMDDPIAAGVSPEVINAQQCDQLHTSEQFDLLTEAVEAGWCTAASGWTGVNKLLFRALNPLNLALFRLALKAGAEVETPVGDYGNTSLLHLFTILIYSWNNRIHKLLLGLGGDIAKLLAGSPVMSRAEIQAMWANDTVILHHPALRQTATDFRLKYFGLDMVFVTSCLWPEFHADLIVSPPKNLTFSPN